MVDMSPSLITRCSLGRSVLAKVWTKLLAASYMRYKVMTQAYCLVGGIANLLAHKLVHPLVGLVVIATVVGEAGDDERHVEEVWWIFLG